MDEHDHGPDPAAIRSMFAGVARRYDLLNHLLSAGLDRRWRQRAAEAVARCAIRAATVRERHPLAGARGSETPPRLVVDVCTGTGDLALAVLGRWPACRVVACDFCRPMVVRARAKVGRAGLGHRAAVVEADALRLPVADAAADAACCAFGVRNLPDEAAGLAELVRVVRPGGRAVVLEFHRPRGRGPLAALFGLYFRRILPTLGARISGGRHGGYAYLVRSIGAFGPPERLAGAMRQAGLEDVTVEPLPGGIASVYVGTRP